ncbi:hypothetical protein AOLI_G00017140 [Acnodon oligacanthus]
MSAYFLRSRKKKRANSDNTEPQVDQRPNNSGHDGTCLDPRGKRKKSSSGSSHRKRQRVEVEDTETEDQQVLPTTADGEEEQPSWFVSNDEKSPEGQSEAYCAPEESQSDQEAKSDHGESEDEELDYDIILREELDRKYVQLYHLGEGGFGSVYAGYRRDDLLPVAVKHIPQNKVRRINVEGEAVSRQTRGASVALLDWCELQDKLVIVMERPEPSKDLTDYVYDSGGYLLEEEGKVILRQLVEGMIDIHSKGVLHRDIKPENILIQMDPEVPQVYILDFGCGNVLTEDPYTSYYGTPEYTPPECFLGGSYQAEPCTVWQIGVVLFFMLIGHLPFYTSEEIISEEPDIQGRLSQGANSDDTEPQVDQRPNNSGHDGTCLDPRGKRKKSSSGSSHRKRQRVEVEDTETEDQQVILRQLVEGMIDIHSKGVLHRDIKPENILIQMDPEGLQVYILDFGCGNVLTEDPYTSYYGMPEYTPPECFLGGSYQAEPCTVWQIGVVLCFMLIGHLPFYTSEEIISEEPDIQGQLSQGANSDDTEPQVDQRPNNSGHDGTCLDPRGKRKKSSSGSSHRKRQRVEVEDTETEDQQVLPTTADGEEGQPSWFVSNDEESSEGQSETDCEPEESQSDQES